MLWGISKAWAGARVFWCCRHTGETWKKFQARTQCASSWCIGWMCNGISLSRCFLYSEPRCASRKLCRRDRYAKKGRCFLWKLCLVSWLNKRIENDLVLARRVGTKLQVSQVIISTTDQKMAIQKGAHGLSFRWLPSLYSWLVTAPVDLGSAESWTSAQLRYTNPGSFTSLPNREQPLSGLFLDCHFCYRKTSPQILPSPSNFSLFWSSHSLLDGLSKWRCKMGCVFLALSKKVLQDFPLLA